MECVAAIPQLHKWPKAAWENGMCGRYSPATQMAKGGVGKWNVWPLFPSYTNGQRRRGKMECVAAIPQLHKWPKAAWENGMCGESESCSLLPVPDCEHPDRIMQYCTPMRNGGGAAERCGSKSTFVLRPVLPTASHTYTHTHARTHACFTRMHARTHKRARATHACTQHAHAYTHTHTHTHKHTHTVLSLSLSPLPPQVARGVCMHAHASRL